MSRSCEPHPGFGPDQARQAIQKTAAALLPGGTLFIIGHVLEDDRLYHPHPGEILRKEFLTPHGLSARRLAVEIDVALNRVTENMRGSRDVSAETVIRLSRRFGTTPQFWLNLQDVHDLSNEEATNDDSRVKQSA